MIYGQYFMPITQWYSITSQKNKDFNILHILSTHVYDLSAKLHMPVPYDSSVTAIISKPPPEISHGHVVILHSTKTLP